MPWKRQFVTVPKKRGLAHEGLQGEAPGSGRRQRKRTELWTRGFTVVSAGSNAQGRVSRFKVGSLNDFSDPGAQELPLEAWYLPWGD